MRRGERSDGAANDQRRRCTTAAGQRRGAVRQRSSRNSRAQGSQRVSVRWQRGWGLVAGAARVTGSQQTARREQGAGTCGRRAVGQTLGTGAGRARCGGRAARARGLEAGARGAARQVGRRQGGAGAAGTCGRGALEARRVGRREGGAAQAEPGRLGLAGGRRRRQAGGRARRQGDSTGTGGSTAGVHMLGSSWSRLSGRVPCRVGRFGRARLQEGGAYRQCTGA